jgi:hypothetical protein
VRSMETLKERPVEVFIQVAFTVEVREAPVWVQRHTAQKVLDLKNRISLFVNSQNSSPIHSSFQVSL